ncbi:MAG: heavy-metal-associated domain-containing protein [Acidobacteriota bacterium]
MYKTAVLTTSLFGILALAVWANTPPGEPVDAQAEATFEVTGMTCGGCAVGVKMAVKKLEGVHKVEASYQEGQAVVWYDPAKVKPDQIVAAIENLGYQAELRKKKAGE